MKSLLLLPLLTWCCVAADFKLGLLAPLRTLAGPEILPRKLVALAGLLAVKHVNERDFGLLGRVDSLALTHNISLLLGDTLSDAGIAVERVLEFQGENIHAIVGPTFSSTAVPVSYVAGAMSLPVLSYAATSVSLSEGHPFFSRVVPTDASYSRALAKLVQSFGWRRVGVLYVDDDFGGGIFREFAAAAGRLNIRTDAAAHFHPGNSESLVEAVSSLRDATVRTILVVTFEDSLEDIARAAESAGLIGGGVTWLLGNPNVQPTTVADTSGSQELNGMFSGWISLLRSNSTAFSTLLSRLKPTDVDFQSIPLTQAELAQMPRIGDCPSCGFAYDAVWTLAFAAARLRNADYGNGSALNTAIRQVYFEGVSGTISLDAATGDPVAEERVFHVVNWAARTDGETTTLDRQKVAELDIEDGFVSQDASGPLWSDGSEGWTAPADWQCGTGSIFNQSTRECRACPAGSFANKDTGACELCGVGSVAGEGFGSCTPCRQGYADEVGMEDCKECPANTMRPAGTLGVWATECLCKKGYYITRGIRREEPECAACPAGAVCHGANATPYPQYGYWADTSCRQHGGDKACDEEWDSFLQCVPATHCLGGPGAPCDKALMGRMCKETRPGWFDIGSSWRFSCDGWGRGMSVLAMLATAGAWFGINYVASGEYDAMDIALLYIQVTGIVSSFGLRWHPTLGMLNTILSIANFDTDFVTPRCLFEWGPLSSFCLQLTLPFIWALAYVLWHCCLALYRWAARGQRESLRHVIQGVRNPVITNTISLLIVVYHSICIKCFQAFNCVHFPNGHSYLSSAPQVECWTGPHWLMVSLATIYIPAFVIGLPVAVVVVIRTKEQQAQLNTVAFHSVWGRLYSRYDPGWKWWEAVLLLRRLLLSLIAVFVSPPMLQSALAVSVLAGLLTVHAYARPYTSDAIDMLEVFTLGGSMLYALFGLLFYPSISPSSQGYVCPDDDHACEEDNAIKAGIAMLLLAWTVATMGLAAWVSYRGIRETSTSKKASAILHGTRKSPLASSGAPSLKSLRFAFGRVAPLRSPSASSESGSDGGPDSGFKFRQRASLKSLAAFHLSPLSSTTSGLHSTVQVGIDAVLKGGPLLKWVKSDQPEATLQASAKAFEEIQSQLTRLSEDDFGPNAVSFRAEAFRQLNGFPGLVDFLSSFASDTQCEHLKTLLDSYSTFLATSKGDYPLSSLVIPESRTSLIHSLIVSGARNRRNFTLICRQIQKSNRKRAATDEAGAEEGDAATIAPGRTDSDRSEAGSGVRPKLLAHRSRLVTNEADSMRGSDRSDSPGFSAAAKWTRLPQTRHSSVSDDKMATLPEEDPLHGRECGEPEHGAGAGAEEGLASTRAPTFKAEDFASGPHERAELPGSVEETAASSKGQARVCWVDGGGVVAEGSEEGHVRSQRQDSGRMLPRRRSA